MDEGKGLHYANLPLTIGGKNARRPRGAPGIREGQKEQKVL